jgi:hypothetical protein
MTHVPAVVPDIVLEAVVFRREHPVAVPLATAYVVAPVPLPPVGVMVMTWDVPAAAVEILSEIERALWVNRPPVALKVKVTTPPE